MVFAFGGVGSLVSVSVSDPSFGWPLADTSGVACSFGRAGETENLSEEGEGILVSVCGTLRRFLRLLRKIGGKSSEVTASSDEKESMSDGVVVLAVDLDDFDTVGRTSRKGCLGGSVVLVRGENGAGLDAVKGDDDGPARFDWSLGCGCGDGG